MFLRPRRPLMRAAMIGTTAYAGYSMGRNAQRRGEMEQEQAARLAQLEWHQMAAAPAPPPAGGVDVVGELQKLASLKDAGAADPAGVRRAKAKLLAE